MPALLKRQSKDLVFTPSPRVQERVQMREYDELPAGVEGDERRASWRRACELSRCASRSARANTLM